MTTADDARPSQPTALPSGWSAEPARDDDVPALHALLVRHEQAARGGSSAGEEDVRAVVVGRGAAARRHLVVRDPAQAVRAWATVHDRAAGRVLVQVVVDPALDEPTGDALAGALLGWTVSTAQGVAAERGLDRTQVDTGAFATDPRQPRWLERAGFEKARTWWQMKRPVTPADGLPDAFRDPHPEVRVRRVRRAVSGGMPEEDDLTTVHDVLEEAFADHFNHHEESFDEFLARLREDPGHRWDHWWIAELVDASSGTVEPAGALVGAVLLPSSAEEPAGSYVEYLGVRRTARGRGGATSLLAAIISDAAERGRDRVGLEVDADSPTGADALYASMGFETSYVTQSWHLEVPVGAGEERGDAGRDAE